MTHAAPSGDYKDWEFDAAGRQRKWKEPIPGATAFKYEVTDFDGDDRPVKRSRTETSSPPGTWTYWAIYSSVTGQKITDVCCQGERFQTNVYLGSTVIAVQYDNEKDFQVTDPVTGSTRAIYETGVPYTYSEFEDDKDPILPSQSELAGLGTAVPPAAPQNFPMRHRKQGGDVGDPGTGCIEDGFFQPGGFKACTELVRLGIAEPLRNWDHPGFVGGYWRDDELPAPPPGGDNLQGSHVGTHFVSFGYLGSTGENPGDDGPSVPVDPPPPCAGKIPTYTQDRKDHIWDRHGDPAGIGGSQYILSMRDLGALSLYNVLAGLFGWDQRTYRDAFEAKIQRRNQFTVSSATAIPSDPGSFVYISAQYYFRPPDTQGEVVGIDRIPPNSPVPQYTNVNTVVVGPNCEVFTSHPGMPTRPRLSDKDPRIFGKATWWNLTDFRYIW